MKKVLYTLLILVLMGLFGFFLAAAKIVDEQTNVVIELDHGEMPAEVRLIHDSLLIADWHADNLLWDRDILRQINHGHVDVPRLIKGNFTLQVFDAVIKTPKGQNYTRNSGDTDNITTLAIANRWPMSTWSSLLDRALYQSKKLHGAEERSDGKLQIIRTKSDLQNLLSERSKNKDLVGGLLAIEGLHALEGKLENLQKVYDAGYRVMGITHFFDNELGGSSAGIDQGGLTAFGRDVILKMNEMDITIDLAHASNKLIKDVLELTTKPIVVSHTGVKGTYESPRNLSDDQLRAIAANGGVVGIGFWDGAVGSPQTGDIVVAMRHTVDIMGIDHVCLGSDWDGGTTTLFDAANIWVLTEALMKGGFSKDEIYKIMGGNQIEFLSTNLPI